MSATPEGHKRPEHNSPSSRNSWRGSLKPALRPEARGEPAQRGGAAYVHDASVRLTSGCVLEGNAATGLGLADGGGVLFLEHGAHGYIEGSIATNNWAEADGGGEVR